LTDAKLGLVCLKLKGKNKAEVTFKTLVTLSAAVLEIFAPFF